MPDRSTLSDRDCRDIQGLVLFGTTCPLLRYHFFTITEPVGGRRFVRAMIEPSSPIQVTTAGVRDEDRPSPARVYVGFTWNGLQAIGASQVTLGSFPIEFREGAKARAAALGDAGPSGPDQWLFDPDTAHVAVIVYARQQTDLDALSRLLLEEAEAHACRLVTMLDAAALQDYLHPSGQFVTRPVHFGYSNGISQPEILPAISRQPGAPPAVPPGMFILGHPDDTHAPGSHVTNTPLPIPAAFSYNGTFGAFRMLEQDVDAFEEFLDRHTTTPDERELLAAKMCGRWRNGVPLTLSPNGPSPSPPLAAADYNRFDYGPSPENPTAVDDRDGLVCPIGAHIRRVNPRSGDAAGGMGHPRLIRRGMPYGPPYDPARRRDGIPRGILGLFLCASLSDQFEVVMRNWSNQTPIAGVGQSGRDLSDVATDGTAVETIALSRFVRTRAAAYLFFPSMTGLRIVSALNEQTQTEAEKQSTDEAIELVVQSMMHAIGTGTTRDAHPKHHGLVKATFEVSSDLPEAVRYGLFARAGTYQAYIRFSNGRPAEPFPPDAAPDVRGMAIKLLSVQGKKEAPDEKLTHDFILASHPVFFVPDALGYVDFLRAASLEEKLRLFPDLLKSFRSFENPLTIRYSSQTPYALGPLAVKYLVVPIDPIEQTAVSLTPQEIAARTPDCLREAMAAHLRQRAATLAFSVQLAPDTAAEQIDDATRLWETAPIRLATIEIPAQDFCKPANDSLADTISFSPWHCLHEHRPLGSVNMARRRVYREASLLRHANRSLPVREPDGVHDLDDSPTGS
jgi:deferrochelatase/peroxidase EfeB